MALDCETRLYTDTVKKELKSSCFNKKKRYINFLQVFCCGEFKTKVTDSATFVFFSLGVVCIQDKNSGMFANYEKSIIYQKSLLRTLGLVSDENRPWQSVFRLFVSLSLLTLLSAHQIITVWFAYDKPDKLDLWRTMFTIAHDFATWVKLLNFFWYRPQILHYIVQLEQHTKYTPAYVRKVADTISEKSINQGASVSMKYIKIRGYLTLSYIIVGILKKELAYPFWYPFDIEPYPFFLIASIQQCLCTGLAIIMQILLDAYFFTYNIILNGYLDILSHALINLLANTNNDLRTMHKRIKECVIYHQNIVELTNILQDHWSIHLLMHGLGNTGMICTMLYIIPVRSVLQMYVTFVICDPLQQGQANLAGHGAAVISLLVVELYIICYYTNELILKSESLLDASYEIAWYEAPHPFKLPFRIFRERLLRPIKLVSGKIFDIKLENFRTVSNFYYVIKKNTYFVIQP